ncbi:MAG: methyl-accepting chemotaxis protein [Cellvibrionaceae bacterium]
MLTIPKVNLNFSWKQKLTIIIAITLIGLVIVAGSAFMSLNSVNNSFTKQSTAVEYKQNSQALTINLLKLESSASALSTDKAQDFIASLNSLEQLSLQMQGQSAALGYNDLIDFSTKLESLTSSYVGLRKDWLNNGLVLGFSTEEGKLSGLTGALGGLEKVSFSMIDDTVSDLVFSQRKYMVSKDTKNEADIEKQIGDLELVVIDMDWQDNVIGKAILAYRLAFDATRGLITKEAQITKALAPITSELSVLVNEQDKFLEETVLQQVAQEANDTRKAAMTVISLAAVIVGLIIFVSLGSIARQLNIQLKHMQAFLKGIAEGDFSKDLPTNNNEKDEFTQLRTASNHMVHDISGVISQVVDGNKSLLDLREQLEMAVEQLGITSEEVEQKTQQSTVATQQISIAVNDVAKRSVDVSETAQSASKATQTGGKVINDCVTSMVNIVALIEKTHEEVTNLAQSSSKMLGIIDVINGLADQTNLLALNAAIESARAGEAGRGFSVVADEVRALAQKTVSATSSIGDLIKGFNDQSKRMGDLMEEGIDLASSGQENANNARSSFETIEDSIQKVAAEMDQVVVAVEEISYNTNDIATQIEHICNQGETTKETRLTMESHTHKLSSQAETLGQLTSRFKLSND